jgi:predicted site-specific integrase-resolvase
MSRPSKLSPYITKQIGDNITLGLSYALAANSVGIKYQTFNSWMSKGKIEKSGKYFQFYISIKKRNADTAKVLLERLNSAAKAGNCQVCIWVLERKAYRKINSVSENKNENFEIIVSDSDYIR